MEYNELQSEQQNFITNFNELDSNELKKFLLFNSYHHLRPIKDVISLYLQDPNARLLGSFDYWKNYARGSSSVLLGESSHIRLFNSKGKVKETLFDYSQTNTAPELYAPVPHNDKITRELTLINTLSDVSNQEYLLSLPSFNEFKEVCDNSTKIYFENTLNNLENFTENEKDFALKITSYNTFEHYGVFVSQNDNFDRLTDNIISELPRLTEKDSLLKAISLGDNLSKEFERIIDDRLDKVNSLTDDLVENQILLNKKFDEITVELFEDNKDLDVPTAEPVLNDESESMDIISNEELTHLEEFLQSYEDKGFKVTKANDYYQIGKTTHNGLLTTSVLELDIYESRQIFVEFFSISENTNEFKAEFYHNLFNKLDSATPVFEETAGGTISIEPSEYLNLNFDKQQEDVLKNDDVEQTPTLAKIEADKVLNDEQEILPKIEKEKTLSDSLNVHSNRLTDDESNYIEFEDLEIGQTYVTKIADLSGEEHGYFKVTSKSNEGVKGISVAERIPSGSQPNSDFEFKDFYFPSKIERQNVSFKDWFTEKRFIGIASENEKSLFEKAFKDELLSLELPNGSGVAEGKFRIYHFFKNNQNILKNDPNAAIRFLKQEYGVGGYTNDSWDVSHDEQGIHFKKPIEQSYSWKQVATELNQLINVFDPRSSSPYFAHGTTNGVTYEEWLKDEATVDFAKSKWGEIREESSNELDLFADFEEIEDLPTSSDSIDLETSIEDVTPQIKKELLDFNFPDNADFYPSTPAEKVESNIVAIKLVKQLESEQRLATYDEQVKLAKYVGWGGLANTFFDESNPRFSQQRKDLKELVSQKEYGEMRVSSLTAYYTDPQIIQAMYKQLDELGFNGGRVLDPSMGSGNFFSAMPKEFKDTSSLYGVELDSITGSIAQQLHQSADIQVKGFETTNFADNALDLVITNVPFGSIMLSDEKYENTYAIHDYFIKKSLDLVHEGGYVAVITSTFTMDKRDDRFRKEISENANLVGAVRLPDNAFKGIAGTDVTSDILIFQKSSQAKIEPSWLNTVSQSDVHGNSINYNTYFSNNPDKVLGNIKIKKFNGGTLSVANNSTHDELMSQLGKSLNFSSDHSALIEAPVTNVKEEIKSDSQNVPRNVLLNIEPFTIMVDNDKAFYFDGKTVSPFQKTSSVTLNDGETRKAQLNRYERNESQIYDKKDFYKSKFAGFGFLDEWGNFYPDNNSLSPLNNEIPNEVKEQWTDKNYNSIVIDKKRYSMAIKDKKPYLTIEELSKTQYFYHVDYNKNEIKAMSKMVEMRHTLQDMLAIQHRSNYDFNEYEIIRERFNNQYDKFISEFGPISSQDNHKLLKKDDYYEFLASVEIEKEDPLTKDKMFVKGDVFFTPTIQSINQEVNVTTAKDALLASLNHKGKLDFGYMEDVYKHSKDDMVQELGNLIYYVGNNDYEIKEDYLSGDVKTKLVIAQTNKSFDIDGYDWDENIRALQEVVPADLTISEINFKLGTRFIPNDVYLDFIAKEFEQTRNSSFLKMAYDKVSDSYKVEFQNKYNFRSKDTYGYENFNLNQSYSGEDLINALLNQKTPKIFKKDPNDPNGKKRIIDDHATSVIQEKGKQLTDAFKDWVLKEPKAQSTITKIYNEKYNRYVRKTYDGSSITVNGLAKKYQLRPHQKNAIMRIVQDGRAGLGHEVGSGKTLTMLASNMKLQELGVIKKPMFVVPKPLIEQFAKEIYSYFPDSRVLVARGEDFTKSNRKRFISRIANGNYNAIIIADSQFEKVGMSKEYQEHFIQNELDESRNSLQNSRENEDGYSRSFTVKQIERKIKGLETRLENLQKSDTETFICFEELGIDFLYVDEFHNYKNLAPNTQLENVKGVADTRSQKAMDMKMKIDYLHSQYNNRHVVAATGTPVSNSVVEMYTMMDYIAPDSLERYGVSNFDSWVSSFGVIEDNFELTASGTFKVNRRFTKFGNVQELMNMFSESWDIQTQEMLNLPVPESEVKIHKSLVTPEQATYIESLIERATAIEEGKVKPWEDNMLKIVGENKKLTLDMRVLDSKKYNKYSSEKIRQLVDEVTRFYNEYDETKGTQLIFSDQSVPLKYRNSTPLNEDETVNDFSAYDEIKRALIEKGIPANEIRFIHEANEKNKESMMKDVRLGKIRVLIGSTSKAGTGLNVQDKLIAIHHLDVPWRPSDIIQRIGRIVRQGNENAKVFINYYITKGSMDSYLWQTIENKLKFINQLMSGKINVREMEDFSTQSFNPSQFKQVAEDDPIKSEYMKLEMDLKKITSSRERFYESKASSDNRIEELTKQATIYKNRAENNKLDIETAKSTENNDFRIDIDYQGNTKTFTKADKASDIGSFLVKRMDGILLSNNMSADSDKKVQVKLADYRGFELYHLVGSSVGDGTERIVIKGKASYSLTVSLDAPTGILTRIDNKLATGLEADLIKSKAEHERCATSAEHIKAEKDLPYPKESEYLEMVSRHAELKEELTGKSKQSEPTSNNDLNKNNEKSTGMSM